MPSGHLFNHLSSDFGCNPQSMLPVMLVDDDVEIKDEFLCRRFPESSLGLAVKSRNMIQEVDAATPLIVLNGCHPRKTR